MNGYVDLHIHTNNSDGTCAVEEIFQMAVHNNVELIAITDHNSLAGVKKAQRLQSQYGVECYKGIEIDSLYQGKRCHILGYHIDEELTGFQMFIEENAKALERADKKTMQALAQEYPIQLEDYENYINDPAKGGWKIINFLVDYKIAADQEQAIQIMKTKKAKPEFSEAKVVIQKIHKAGGVAVLAHPGVTFKDNDLHTGEAEYTRKLNEMKEFGIDGIECFYPSHKTNLQNFLEKYADKNNLLITSGSDFHGDFFKYSKQSVGSEFKTRAELVLSR